MSIVSITSKDAEHRRRRGCTLADQNDRSLATLSLGCPERISALIVDRLEALEIGAEIFHRSCCGTPIWLPTIDTQELR